MNEVKKNKERLTSYIIIIALVISVLAIGINDYRNAIDKDHYKMLYNEKSFELTDTIQNYNIKLKNKIDTILSSGNINSKDASTIENYSQKLYFNYMELHANCVNNNSYVKYNVADPRCNLFYTIRNYIGYLNVIVNSSSGFKLNITPNSDISKSLKLISDMCGDINKVFEDYRSGIKNEIDVKAKIMQSNGWVTILNNIEGVFNDNFDSTEILNNSSNNYYIQD